MEDITPQLIEAVTTEFRKAYGESEKIQDLLNEVQAGTATYAQAQEYSLEVSRLIGKAYEKHISSAVLPDGKMYYNIASRLIPETMDENYRLVADYSASVQTMLNRKAGIGIKAQIPQKEQSRIDGLVELASNSDQYDDVAKQLGQAFGTYSQSIVDRSVWGNVKFHYDSGLKPRITRRAARECCPWCRALAGKYNYPDVPRDVYRRHANCRCTVEYDPADGSKQMQNIWTKDWN